MSEWMYRIKGDIVFGGGRGVATLILYTFCAAPILCIAYRLWCAVGIQNEMRICAVFYRVNLRRDTAVLFLSQYHVMMSIFCRTSFRTICMLNYRVCERV